MGIGILKKLASYKFICGTCGVLSVVSLVVAVMNPATGYELSIYASTPLVVWVLILFNMAVSVLLLVREASQAKPSNRWWFALGILMANGIMVLEMSTLRGYYTMGRDTLMHIGYVKDMAYGIVSIQNMYPGVHAIPALLVLLGLSPTTATNLSLLFWYLIYVASVYGLSRFIWEDKSKVIIATTLSAVLLLPHTVGMASTFVAASMFPLTLLVVLRLRRNFKIKDIVVFLVFVAVMSMLHPLALEATLISLVIACLLFSGNRWKAVALAVALLPLVVWWYGYWYRMDVVHVLFKDIAGGVSSLVSTPLVSIPLESVPSASESPTSVSPLLPSAEQPAVVSILPSTEGIQMTQTVGNFGTFALLLRRYGCEICLGFLAVLSCLLIMVRYMRRKPQNILYMYFGSVFVVLNLMWLAGWYLQLATYSAMLSRMMYWVTTLSILIVVPLFARLLSSQRLRRLSVVGVSIALIVISCVTIFNRYPSPIIGTENLQVTRQEMRGIEWIFEHGDPKVYIVHLNSQRVSRYIAVLKGVEWVRNNQMYYWLSKYEENNGEFNYNGYSSISEKYPEGVYLVVTKLDRSLPRWHEGKLYLIEYDPSATLIYKDGDEFQVFLVGSLGEK